MTSLAPDDLRAISWYRTACKSGEARRIRERAGITQSEIARAVGVEPAAVSRWESGGRTPATRAALELGYLLREMEAQP